MLDETSSQPIEGEGDEATSRAQLRRFFMEQCGQTEMAAQILDAAMCLFARKGYAATSVREIVTEARVTNPMLYYYFQSKEGVFRALIDMLVSSFNGQLEQFLLLDCPLDEKLHQIAEHHIRTAREVPMALRFMFSSLFGPRESAPMTSSKNRIELLNKIAQMFEDSVRSGELHITPGFTPFYLAQSFMGLLTNQMMLALKIGDTDRDNPDAAPYMNRCMSEQNINDIIRFFFAGAGSLKERA